ncbi:PKD domain-containing protein [Ornithinimicrobium pekingense]|uniref:Uncharacterized protein n=1 Tax=Ornithinimicrobium pekingense TaxID=384677 RepID=A0ABQ2FCP9_9MICO|nr:hypothetical protein [Ornithinimicrobium pekingense]GGK83407.1 hypothetical protein GCM10011509_34820 [Ornithinimicrobium pekingense]
MTTTTLPQGRRGRHLPPPSRHARRRLVSVATATALLATGAGVAIAEVTKPNPTQLAAFGPISGEHGYPTWYEDSTGLRLQQCLDIEDPYCDPAFLRGEMPDPDGPVSFPDNWPLESFYFLAGASLDMPGGGSAILTSGLEATMANEGTVDGDQVVFGRQRFDIDFPGPGTYVVTHPYGEDTFTVTSTDFEDYRYVEDITPAPGNFGLALRSRINPFLVSTGGLVTTDKGTYVGDPGTPTTVTGSPYDTNLFQVEQLLDTGERVLVASTDQFTLMGKVSTNSGIDPQAATLVETADGRYLDVFATTDAGKSISVSGSGLSRTTLDADGGRYFGRVPLGSTTPGTVTFTNEGDDPVATRSMTVTDGVTITEATYDTGTDTLTVSASSTDEVDPPTLTLSGAGDPVALVDGTVTMQTSAPPATVSVSSSGGGTDQAPVTVGGGAAGERAATIAAISGPVQTVVGDEVTLTSASLNADSLLWEQTGGTDVGVHGATNEAVTFTAPDGGGLLTFRLTATGPDGQTSTTSSFGIEVLTERPPAPEPVATATATPTSAAVGQTVTVSGTGSQNAVSHSWTQTAGTPVTFDASAPSFTFAMPSTTEALAFELTVTNADGVTATTRVSVSQIADVLTVSSAQYRADKGEWRVAGTASITSVNTVRVYLRNADGSRGALVGESVVSAPVTPGTPGDWTVRVRGGVSPGTATQVLVESTRGGSTVAAIQRR